MARESPEAPEEHRSIATKARIRPITCRTSKGSVSKPKRGRHKLFTTGYFRRPKRIATTGTEARYH